MNEQLIAPITGGTTRSTGGATARRGTAVRQRTAGRKPLGALAGIIDALPKLNLGSGGLDLVGSPRAIVHRLISDMDTAVGAINRGIGAIGLLIADSSPEIEDGTISQESVEALGWLLSELGELASACVVLAAQCRQAHPSIGSRS
jgi:hypothetical protein